MGFCRVISASVQGFCVEFVQVEADVSNGLPVFHMVGYLSSEVKEAAERVRTAIRNTGILLPAKKVIVNISPADRRKKGTAFDLPVAAAVLAALEVVPSGQFDKVLLLGELGLDGRLCPVEGVLPIVMEAASHGYKTCILPAANMKEGALAGNMEILGAENLAQVIAWAREKKPLKRPEKTAWENHVHERQVYDIDYSDIQGQEGVKRATLVAVAGNHNLLYIGPPGAGKTMMAKRVPTILPALTREESMEITKIYSVAGGLRHDSPMAVQRPYREVHHTVTRQALAGGGRIPSPGECTLAHNGVLFLDELAEFPRHVLEALRQPLEERKVRLTRQRGAYEFPADFMLVAASNPCPCGNYPDLNKCTCTDYQIQSYLGRISQPFLDRIDICSEVPRVGYEALAGTSKGQCSADMRSQVEAARERQRYRFAGETIRTNTQMNQEQIEKYCVLSPAGRRMMRQAFDIMGLTARTYYKTLKVARTAADLDDADTIKEEHLAEALSYRTMEKTFGKR